MVSHQITISLIDSHVNSLQPYIQELQDQIEQLEVKNYEIDVYILDLKLSIQNLTIENEQINKETDKFQSVYDEKQEVLEQLKEVKSNKLQKLNSQIEQIQNNYELQQQEEQNFQKIYEDLSQNLEIKKVEIQKQQQAKIEQQIQQLNKINEKTLKNEEELELIKQYQIEVKEINEQSAELENLYKTFEKEKNALVFQLGDIQKQVFEKELLIQNLKKKLIQDQNIYEQFVQEQPDLRSILREDSDEEIEQQELSKQREELIQEKQTLEKKIEQLIQEKQKKQSDNETNSSKDRQNSTQLLVLHHSQSAGSQESDKQNQLINFENEDKQNMVNTPSFKVLKIDQQQILLVQQQTLEAQQQIAKVEKEIEEIKQKKEKQNTFQLKYQNLEDEKMKFQQNLDYNRIENELLVKELEQLKDDLHNLQIEKNQLENTDYKDLNDQEQSNSPNFKVKNPQEKNSENAPNFHQCLPEIQSQQSIRSSFSDFHSTHKGELQEWKIIEKEKMVIKKKELLDHLNKESNKVETLQEEADHGEQTIAWQKEQISNLEQEGKDKLQENQKLTRLYQQMKTQITQWESPQSSQLSQSTAQLNNSKVSTNKNSPIKKQQTNQ